jgi:hypothetical protein
VLAAAVPPSRPAPLAARVELQPLVVISTAPFGRGAFGKNFSICASLSRIGMLFSLRKTVTQMTENQ